MFTGLIESVCPVRTVAASGTGGMTLGVDLGSLAQGARVGDSIAISGACLTVSRLAGTVVHFDVSPETLHRTTLGALRPSSNVNVERALEVGDRIGGHVVQGHVDGVAAVRTVARRGEFLEMAFGADADLLGSLVTKGSVAVDGVSLTVVHLGDTGFTVAIIPQTASATTLGTARTGDRVNIETDLVVKAVRRVLEQMLGRGSGLTVDRLKEMGF
jgi:riboflavin synthase